MQTIFQKKICYTSSNVQSINEITINFFDYKLKVPKKYVRLNLIVDNIAMSSKIVIYDNSILVFSLECTISERMSVSSCLRINVIEPNYSKPV